MPEMGYKSATGGYQAVDEGHPLPVGQAGSLPIGAHLTRVDLATMKTLTPPPEGANLIWVSCTGQPVRWALTPGSEGTAPTVDLGHLMYPNDPPLALEVGSDDVLKVIETAATARLNYCWRRQGAAA